MGGRLEWWPTADEPKFESDRQRKRAVLLQMIYQRRCNERSVSSCGQRQTGRSDQDAAGANGRGMGGEEES